MNTIQIVLTVLFGGLILRVLLLTRWRALGWRRSLFWVLLWAAGLLAVWFPQATTRVANTIGVGRGADAILYFSVALLSYLVFRLYVALDRQEQTLTRLVSELALRDADANHAREPRA
jgi:hypothetical protein